MLLKVVYKWIDKRTPLTPAIDRELNFTPPTNAMEINKVLDGLKNNE